MEASWTRVPGSGGIIKLDDDNDGVVKEVVNEAMCRGLLQVDEILEGNSERTDDTGTTYMEGRKCC